MAPYVYDTCAQLPFTRAQGTDHTYAIVQRMLHVQEVIYNLAEGNCNFCEVDSLKVRV